MGKIAEYLKMLRDVEGVHGSFVVAGSGSLVEKDLPAAFDSELLGEVGLRVARLYETFFSGGGDLETCMLRYAEHKVYVRKMTWGILAILSGVRVNLPALRMVVNLVVRRIDPEIVALSGSIPPAPQRISAPPPSSAKAPLPAPAARMPSAPERTPSISPEDGREFDLPSNDRHVRRYRGQPVDDG